MSKPQQRIVFSYQEFRESGMPTNIQKTFPIDPKLSREKTFEHIIARIREEYFTPKTERRLHD